MTDVFLTWEETIDPAGCNTSPDTYLDYSRDGTRTPFPWDDSLNAGFSTGSKTWLPVASNYKTVNVKAQRSAPFSHMKIFKTLTQLRRTKTMQEGNLIIRSVNNDILTYMRTLTGSETIVVVLNLGSTQQTIDLTTVFTGMTTNLEVITSSLSSSFIAG